MLETQGEGKRPRGLRLLLGNTASYAASNLLQRSLTFLLIPLYARFFSRGEFGAMEQVYQMVMVLTLLSSVGLTAGLVRGIYLDKQNEDERDKMLGALVSLLLPLVACVVIGLWVWSEPIAQWLFHGEGSANWIRLSALLFLAMSIQQLPMQLLRTMQDAKRYTLWSIVLFSLIAVGNVYLIVVRRWGLSGMIVGNILGFGVTGVLIGVPLLRKIRWNAEFRRLSPLFAFGLPMLPALLCRKILEIADRYIIPQYHGMETLGVYVMGAKVANIIDIALLTPFLFAWQPYFYSHADNPDAPDIFASVTLYFLMLLCTGFLILYATRDQLLSFLGGGKYSKAGPVVTVLALSAVFNGVQYCISPGIHIRRKLVQEMMVMIAAAVVNLVLNFLLIPSHGGMGAAVATASAYFFYLVVTFALSNRNYPIPYYWNRIGNVTIQTMVAYIILIQFDSLLIKLSIFILYLLTCPVLDLWRHGDWDKIIQTCLCKGTLLKKAS